MHYVIIKENDANTCNTHDNKYVHVHERTCTVCTNKTYKYYMYMYNMIALYYKNNHNGNSNITLCSYFVTYSVHV